MIPETLSYETYSPTNRQMIAHKSKAKFKLYGGAMGGGKTVWLCAEAIALSLDFPGNRGYLCRKTYRDFKKTTLQVLLEMLPVSLIKQYNKSDGEITLKNNSKIIMGDLEKTDKLKSMNLGWFGIDEASETTDDIFKMLRTRLRLKIPGIKYYGLMASNPEPGWLKERFVDPQEEGAPRDGHLYIRSLPKDNPHLPTGYLEELIKDLPPLWRTKYLEGSWDVFDSQIFRPHWIKPTVGTPDIASYYTCVDPAIGEKDENDETCICTLGIDYDGLIHEIETISGRWSFNLIVENCEAVSARYKPDMFGVEYVAFQKALGDVLSSKGIVVTPLKADTDKVRRSVSIQDMFEKDRVRINNRIMQKQLLEFPKGTHDDYVDAIVYGLRLIKNFAEDKYTKKIDKYKDLDSRSKQFWKLHNDELDDTRSPEDVMSDEFGYNDDIY